MATIDYECDIKYSKQAKYTKKPIAICRTVSEVERVFYSGKDYYIAIPSLEIEPFELEKIKRLLGD